MRYLNAALAEFASEKLVFLAGPRQVGKSTLAREWLAPLGGRFLNWDVTEDREKILTESYLRPPPPALVLDELHKYPRWKRYLKGLVDREGARMAVVVTGSARLDTLRRGSGESLLGRHEYLRLCPFSIAELQFPDRGVQAPPSDWLGVGSEAAASPLWEQLERRGGFPEPLFRDEDRQHRRWVMRRRELIIREDLRDLSQVRAIELVEHLALLLPARVGSPLSLNRLREELQVAHDTVSNWISMLERVYYCFRIRPFSRRLARSLRKEAKLYLWDWSTLRDEGARFENIVAVHLLKALHAWTDLGYGDFDLHYYRNKEKEEVDFVITNERVPVALLECKLSDTAPAASLLALGEALGRIPQIQLVRQPGVDTRRGRLRVVEAAKFLGGLV